MHLLELSCDCLAVTVQFLDVYEIVHNLSLTCKTMYDMTLHNPVCWSMISHHAVKIPLDDIVAACDNKQGHMRKIFSQFSNIHILVPQTVNYREFCEAIKFCAKFAYYLRVSCEYENTSFTSVKKSDKPLFKSSRLKSISWLNCEMVADVLFDLLLASQEEMVSLEAKLEVERIMKLPILPNLHTLRLSTSASTWALSNFTNRKYDIRLVENLRVLELRDGSLLDIRDLYTFAKNLEELTISLTFIESLGNLPTLPNIRKLNITCNEGNYMFLLSPVQSTIEQLTVQIWKETYRRQLANAPSVFMPKLKHLSIKALTSHSCITDLVNCTGVSLERLVTETNGDLSIQLPASERLHIEVKHAGTITSLSTWMQSIALFLSKLTFRSMSLTIDNIRALAHCKQLSQLQLTSIEINEHDWLSTLAEAVPNLSSVGLDSIYPRSRGVQVNYFPSNINWSRLTIANCKNYIWNLPMSDFLQKLQSVSDLTIVQTVQFTLRELSYGLAENTELQTLSVALKHDPSCLTARYCTLPSNVSSLRASFDSDMSMLEMLSAVICAQTCWRVKFGLVVHISSKSYKFVEELNVDTSNLMPLKKDSNEYMKVVRASIANFVSTALELLDSDIDKNEAHNFYTTSLNSSQLRDLWLIPSLHALLSEMSCREQLSIRYLERRNGNRRISNTVIHM